MKQSVSWRIDYLTLLEEKRGGRGKVKSARWREWHEEYLGFMNEKVPQEDYEQFPGLLMAITPDLKVVMLTGFASLDTAKKAVDTGVIDYVSKPLDLKLISEIIEDIL